jgi:hypothetical protein
MLKRALELGSYLDWITPLTAFFRDWAHRPSHTFLIPEDCGWSALEIQRMLRLHGIKTWGLMIVKGSIMISMRYAQAHWAQYLLRKEEIPIEYGILEQRPIPAYKTSAHEQRPTRAPVRPHTGIWAELARILYDVIDEISTLFKP